MRFKILFWILMAPSPSPHKVGERSRAEGSITSFSSNFGICLLLTLQPPPTTSLSFHRGHPGSTSSYHSPKDQCPPKSAPAELAPAVQPVVAMPLPTLCPGEAKANPLCLPPWQGSREVEAVEPDYTSTRGLVKLLLAFKYIFRDCSAHVVFNFHTWLFAVIEVYD